MKGRGLKGGAEMEGAGKEKPSGFGSGKFLYM